MVLLYRIKPTQKLKCQLSTYNDKPFKSSRYFWYKVQDAVKVIIYKNLLRDKFGAGYQFFANCTRHPLRYDTSRDFAFICLKISCILFYNNI